MACSFPNADFDCTTNHTRHSYGGCRSQCLVVWDGVESSGGAAGARDVSANGQPSSRPAPRQCSAEREQITTCTYTRHDGLAWPQAVTDPRRPTPLACLPVGPPAEPSRPTPRLFFDARRLAQWLTSEAYTCHACFLVTIRRSTSCFIGLLLFHLGSITRPLRIRSILLRT